MSLNSIRTRRGAAFLSALAMALVAIPTLAVETADTTTLLKAAEGGPKDKRDAAIDHLGERHDDPAHVLPELQKLLDDSDPHVRWRAARALGDYGDQAKDTGPKLRKLLTDKDAIVQYHAAIALGKIEDHSDETVEALLTAATSKDARVARGAIAALRELKPGPKRVAEMLAKSLKSNDQAVTMHALEALVEEGPKAVPLLKEALGQPETAYLACTAIDQIGPDAAPTVPELTKLLTTTKHSQVLIQALLALASIGPEAAAAEPQIDTVLKTSKDATVPVAAAYALGSIGAKDSEAALKAAAASKDNEFLKMTATWALAKLHPEDEAAMKTAVEVLAQGLKSNKMAMRNAAAKSLQSLHAPPELVTPALVALMNDPSPEVHANAIEAIASLGESVVPKLIIGLKNPQLRGPAIRVITKIGPKAAAAVEPLMEAANNAEPKVKTEIFFALASIGPAAAPATEMLAKAITSKETNERESALFALRKIGPGAKAAVKPLTERMNADDSFDADAAAWALSRIAADDADVLKAVVPKLIKGLSAKNEQSRIESIEALAEMGPAAASANSALEHAAKEDSSEAVRDAAEAALHPKAAEK